MNEDFVGEAFNKKEQKLIKITNVENKNNSEYETKGGKDTKDKIFLLSIDEAEKYFLNKKNGACKPTPYAISNNCWVSENGNSQGNCWFWLRSSGLNNDYASFVDNDSDVYSGGRYVNVDSGGVRPALWVNLK